ncbi:MAG: hypothetical protein K1X63_07725 [Chitinophagales bacterium]|nr:hypothetical protein [Bacteroidota bacterium]MBX7140951.1 hypothetical protein [Chitinophagales bacterium]
MKNQFFAFIRPVAIAGNLMFLFWILYNGINEGFAGTLVEKVSYIALMLLLAANCILLLNKKAPVVGGASEKMP